MRKVILLLGAILTLSCFTTSFAGQAIRIGTVDSQKLQTVLQAIWAQESKPGDEFKSQQDEIKKLTGDITSKRELLKDKSISDKKKEAVTAELKSLQQLVSKKQNDLRKVMVEQRTKRAEEIKNDIKSDIAAVARNQKVNLVLGSHQVLFADTEVDLTDAVINSLNKKHKS